MKRAWVALTLIAFASSASAQDRPNVVIMLADNVGCGDIGAYGAGEVRGMPTPRIDQLASARRSTFPAARTKGRTVERQDETGSHSRARS